MTDTSFTRSNADGLVAAAIARIGERRDHLDRLADVGMDMCRRLAAGETVQREGGKPWRDPAHAFAVISRAVRMALALASRLDQEIIALCKGGPIPNLAICAPETESAPEPTPPAPPPGPRERIARAVDAAIVRETPERDALERQRGWVWENLFEKKTYDALLNSPWRAVVAAICSDLGLRPDWSAWSNTDGFPAEAETPAAEPPDPAPRPAMAAETSVNPPPEEPPRPEPLHALCHGRRRPPSQGHPPFYLRPRPRSRPCPSKPVKRRGSCSSGPATPRPRTHHSPQATLRTTTTMKASRT